MSLIETSLAVISVVSFALAVFSFVRNHLLKVREQANVELVKQQLTSLLKGLEAALHSVDAIVQIPKQRDASTDELQDLARVVRGQLFVLHGGFKDSRIRMDAWKFGELLVSQDYSALIDVEKLSKADNTKNPRQDEEAVM